MQTIVIEIEAEDLKELFKLIAYFQKELKGHCASIYVFKEPPTYKEEPIAEYYVE